MSVNGISNARLAVASLVHGVGFLRRTRAGKDEPPLSGLSRAVRALFALRRVRRVNPETSLRDALARNKATRVRFERLMAQALAPEDAPRRAAWLRQTRLAMQELDELLSGRDPGAGESPPVGGGGGVGEQAVNPIEGGRDE